jgi:hypothetical protein
MVDGADVAAPGEDVAVEPGDGMAVNGTTGNIMGAVVVVKGAGALGGGAWDGE